MNLMLTLALLGEPTEPAGRLSVTLVTTRAESHRLAAGLSPHLDDAGFTDARFRRCEDFACVTAPLPGRPVQLVVILDEGDSAMVIAEHGDPQDVIVDEVAVEHPMTALDDEALGYAVVRALSDPPLRLRTDWTAAQRLGLDRAPPPEPEPEPEPTPRPPAAFSRGAYAESALGFATSASGVFPYATATALGGGFMFEGRDGSAFRISIGGRATYIGAVRRGDGGIAATLGWLGLGASTKRMLVRGVLGVGPGVVWGDYYGETFVTGLASIGASVLGRVGRRFAPGIEVGGTVDFINLETTLHGMLTLNVFWDVPKRGGSR